MQKRLSRTLDLYFVSYKDEYTVVHVCFLAEHVELTSLENEIQNRWFTLGMCLFLQGSILYRQYARSMAFFFFKKGYAKEISNDNGFGFLSIYYSRN